MTIRRKVILLYRTPLEPPTPILTAPPIFTQVSVPSTLTNPGPNAAHEWPAAAPRQRSQGGCFASRLFIACHPLLLPDELDADRLSAAPDHFAGSAGPCVACERQPQFRWQHVGIINSDLGTGRGHVLHHALARREAAIKGDPAGLA